ncbi:MAG TPA: Ig-like domain-containing protein [Pseudoduganella sp.]
MNHPYFPAEKRRRSLRRSSQLLPLEQRFMFDGAVADAAQTAQAHELPPAPPAVTVRAAEPAKDGGKKEVAIVDTSLAGYKTLEAGVRAGVGIVEFDGSKDGLAQIAQWAATQSNYDAIHILSHGAQGVVELGTMHLSQSALASAATQRELAQLGKALTSDGDLLLYGCDVGAGAQGAALLDGLARATGADVAASTDASGAAAKGGNWTLEAHTGKIDTRALGISDYLDLLTVVTITSSDADYSNYQFTKSVNGVTFTFTGDPNAGLGMDSTFSGLDGLFAYDSTTPNGVKLTITAQSGYMFDLSGLDVGTYATNGITIQYTDASNNTGSVSPAVASGSWQTLTGLGSTVKNVVSIVLTADDFTDFQNFDFINITTIAPAAVVNSAALSSDTGTSNSDFVTNVAGQTITGSLSSLLGAGEKVEVSYDNGNTWSDATSYTVGSSSWSTTTTLSGSNTFKARVTNALASSTAYSHTYTLDTTAPSTAFSNAALSSDTGVSNTDFITNSASQTISATLSSTLGAGDVLKGSLDGGSTWTDITAKVSGTTLTWNGATLGSGNNTLMLKVTDAAGNDSSAYSRSYTLDTIAPATSISSIGFSSDSGSSASDFITSVAAQTISGTLSANLQSGETVYVSMDNGSTWTAATATVGASTWSLSGVTLTGSNTMRIKVSDTAGNDGTVRTQAYIYDATAPATTFSGLAFSNDSGVAGDFTTNTANQTISASLSGGLAAGETLYGSLDGGATWSDITSMASGTTLSWTGVTLAGSNTLQLKVVDAAGNQGPTSSQAYVLDTSAPAAPSAPVLTSDSGLSGSDLVTNVNTPTFTGSAESGSTVKIYDGATLLGSVTATGGVWSYTSTTLADGSHNISATATDVAGNVSAASAAIAVTVDTTAPVVNSVSVPANGTYYTGNTLDFTVNFSEAVYVDSSGGTPRIALVIGSSTRYADYVSGSGTSALVFRHIVVNGDSDSDGITVGGLASNGGTLSDLAGNIGVNTLNSVGSTAAVLVDGSQPGVTNISSSTADGAYRAGSTITITVDFSGAVNVDTTGGTPTMALNSGGTAIYSGGSGSSTLAFSYTVGAGENSADLDYSSSGALSLNGATIAAAGGSNQNASLTLAAPGAAGSLGANKNIDIDTIAPAITGSTASFSADTGISSTDLITNVAAQSLSGTLTGALSAGDSVQVSLDNGSTWTTATAAGSSWSLAAPVILTASNTLQVRVVDSAGNVGSAASYAYVLDTTAPATSFSNVAFSNDTGISNSDLITSVSAQTISANLSGAMASGERLFGSLDNGATWTDITGKVSGTTLNWDGVTLTGSNNLQLQMVDAAGNDGAVTSKAYVLDTTAPTNTIASASFSNDSGSSASDFITNVAAQTISGTLSANLAAGETVYVSLDNGASWQAATASAGQNSWSLGGQTLGASHVLLVKVSDLSGQDGPVYSQAYVYDAAAPSMAGSTVSFSADTGISSTDLVTSVAAQNISGTLPANLAAGETVYVSLDNGASWHTAAAGVGQNGWSLAGQTLGGNNTLLVKVGDTAGNESAIHAQAYAYDTAAPVTPSADTLLSSGLTPVLSGSATLANGETLTVTVGGAQYAVNANNGHWTLDLSSATPVSGSLALAANSSYDIIATAIDLAGNASSGAGRLTISSMPLVTGVKLSDDSGISNSDFITNIAAQTVSGTLSAPPANGQTVEVSVDGGATWSTATASGDTWSANVTLSGANTLMARVASVSGSGASLQHAYVLDTTAPTTIPTLISLSTNGDIDGALSAPLSAGETLVASLDSGSTWTAVNTIGQAWSLTSNGAGSVQVAVRDSAGNSGATLVVNTALPPAIPLAVTPSMPVVPSGTPFAFVPGGDQQHGQDQPDTTAPLVLPLTGVGGDIATGWPGAAPKPMLDILPAAITLPPVPGFDPGRSVRALTDVQGSTGVTFQIVTVPELPGGDVLVAYRPIPDVSGASGQRISVQVSTDAFAHSSRNASVELSAQSADGSPLPGWIRFDGRTGRFEGTPPQAFEGTLSFKVTARDSQGHIATQVFKIIVSKDGQAGKRSESHVEPGGRSSLGEQLRTARSAGAARLAVLSP